MNKQQQQNAMLKLATVRLAINHVLRSRAMQKQAEGPQSGQGWGVSPEYEWLRRFDEVMSNSPNRVYTGDVESGPADLNPGHLAQHLSKPYYARKGMNLQSPEVQQYLNTLYEAYNEGVPMGVGPKIIPGSDYQINAMPAWGVDSVMNASTPVEKSRAAERFIEKQNPKNPAMNHSDLHKLEDNFRSVTQAWQPK